IALRNISLITSEIFNPPCSFVYYSILISISVGNKNTLPTLQNTQRLPVEQKHEEVLSVLGLFILNRFRKITYEEVIAMLKFDLMDTVAGKQLYEMGLQKGHGDGLQNARENAKETLLEVLNIRFGIVPNDIIEKIRATSRLDMLKHLIIQATLSSDLENFKGRLPRH
ncbi:MAG: hypothetical protein KAI83_01985, partial [Thiomargarita sp.]|nr:hypothetical protein [Thiomargarita sp.]